jgi:hypothetical protein
MGQIVPSPRPIPPSHDVWAARRGQSYILFIDETFSQFFELNERGYFCYGAVGIPEIEHEALARDFDDVLTRYRGLLVPDLKELKHTEFKRIPFDDRWSLAQKIRTVLLTHGCFVCGFYTPARAFLLERLRADIMDELASIPVAHTDLLFEIAKRERDGWEGPGQSGVLRQLLALPVTSAIHAIAGLGCKVRVVYDARQKKEDKALKAIIEELVGGMSNVWSNTDGRLTAYDETGRSNVEVGLQIADIIAGETRAFLDANPDLQEHGASAKIITQTTDEPFMAVDQIRGRDWKTGVVTRMPNALARRFFQRDPKQRSVLPCFADVLLAGVLTCYSSWGTPRHLMFYDRLIFDQTDK